MRGTLIGIMGQSESGKDTMADYLVEEYGFVKMALADAAKRLCREVFRFTDEQLWGPSSERNQPDLRYVRPGIGNGFLTPRVSLQVICGMVREYLYEDAWVESLLRDISYVQAGTCVYSPRYGLSSLPLTTRLKRKVSGFQSPGVVIPDVRHLNELEGIQRAGGYVIRTRRVGKYGNVGLRGHTSEEQQKGIPDSKMDAVLEVPEGLPAYYRSIDKTLAKLPGMGNHQKVEA